jgi:hypothetical protein
MHSFKLVPPSVVDNTTPYVPETFNDSLLRIAINFRCFESIIFGDYSIFGKRHLPRVMEQKMMWVQQGVVPFLDRMPCRHRCCTVYAVRAWCYASLASGLGSKT